MARPLVPVVNHMHLEVPYENVLNTGQQGPEGKRGAGHAKPADGKAKTEKEADCAHSGNPPRVLLRR